jgi:hypothetical protein
MKKNIFITFISILSFVAFSQNKANIKILKKLNETTSVIELENNYKAIYNISSKIILVDSIVDFYLMENVKCIIAKVENRVYGYDELMGEDGYYLFSTFYIFNFNGTKISPEKLYLKDISAVDGTLYYQMPTCSKDNQCVILENNSKLFGVISNEGIVILPFKFKQIEFSEDENHFITNSFFNEEKKYSRSGERVFGNVAKEQIKIDFQKGTFKGIVKSYTQTTFRAKKSFFKFKKSVVVNDVNYCFVNKQLLGVERIYDSIGNLKSTIKSHFDENEKLLQQDFYDSISHFYCYNSFAYSDKELKIRSYKISDSTYTLYTYKYDERCNEIESFYPLNWNKVDEYLASPDDFFEGNTEKIIYKFDDKGNKIIEEHFNQITNDGYKELFSKKTYAYDFNNKKIEENEYDGKSLLKSKTKYSYNERGDITEEVKYNDNGVVIGKQSYKIKYDSIGNWIEKVHYLNNKPNSIVLRVINY